MTLLQANSNAVVSNGATVCQIAHNGSVPDGTRSVLAVLTADTQSVTTILVTAGGAPGGWTARSTVTGQGKKWSLFDKICGPSEPSQYAVTFTPGIVQSGDLNDVVAYLADFTTDGDPIRAVSSADSASGTTLTLPSLSTVAADDICAVVWNNPATTTGRLLAVSPLAGSNGVDGGMDLWTQLGHQDSFRSSSATGTRSFTVGSGTHSGALAAMMIVGVYPPLLPTGGWGVGMVRMGAN